MLQVFPALVARKRDKMDLFLIVVNPSFDHMPFELSIEDAC